MTVAPRTFRRRRLSIGYGATDYSVRVWARCACVPGSATKFHHLLVYWKQVRGNRNFLCCAKLLVPKREWYMYAKLCICWPSIELIMQSRLLARRLMNVEARNYSRACIYCWQRKTVPADSKAGLLQHLPENIIKFGDIMASKFDLVRSLTQNRI